MSEHTIRRAWQIVGVLVAGVLLPFGTLQTVSALAHEQYTSVTRFGAPGLRLVEIHNYAGGPVRVVGTDADAVTVRAAVSDGMRATGHSEAIDGEKLVLESSCPMLTTFCEVTYEVEVPAGLDVSVSVPSSVSVEDVTGDVTIDAEEFVELARLGGELRASSRSGSVSARDLRSTDVDVDASLGSVTLAFTRSPQAVRAESTDGDIEIVLPADAPAYRVRSTTTEGSTATEISTDPTAPRTITTHTTNGTTTIHYPTS